MCVDKEHFSVFFYDGYGHGIFGFWQLRRPALIVAAPNAGRKIGKQLQKCDAHSDANIHCCVRTWHATHTHRHIGLAQEAQHIRQTLHDITLLIRFINMRVTMRDAWWKQSEDRARVVVICAWQRGALCALRRPMYMALVSFTILPLSPLPPLPLNKHTDFCDKCVSITCVAQVAVNTAPEDSRERGSRRESDAKE